MTEFDFKCEKMNCKMTFNACIKRQELLRKKKKSKGWGFGGQIIMTDECEDCEKGRENELQNSKSRKRRKRTIKKVQSM